MSSASKSTDAHPHLARARAREVKISATRKRSADEVKRPFEAGHKEVTNPFNSGPVVITVECNRRESPFEHMASRGQLSASQQYAGTKFRQLYEQAQVSPLRATNPMLEPVDGGRLVTHQPSDHTRHAMRALNEACERIGQRSARLLRAVIGEGVSIDDLAPHCGGQSIRAARAYVSGRFREALDDLVVIWGIDATGAPARRTYAAPQVQPLAGSREWKVGAHGDMVECSSRWRG